MSQREFGEDLVNRVFDSWARGETSDKIATDQLSKIVEAASDDEVKTLATASLETVKAGS